MDKPQSASMYESAKKIYPREIGGRFDRLSKLATVILLGLFYLVPWLLWTIARPYCSIFLHASSTCSD